jgi:hypothetical protein
MGRGRKTSIPWAEIDPLLLAGALNPEEIAEHAGCALRTIYKRMRVLGVTEVVPAAVAAEAHRRLTLKRVQLGDIEAADPRDMDVQKDVRRAAITVMVKTTMAVVGRHQERIHAGQEIVSRLFAELADVTEHMDEVAEAIDAETTIENDDGSTRVNYRARNRMLRAVALPERAATVDRLASALEKLVKLERQAWNVPDIQPAEPPRHAEVDTPEVIQTLRALSATIRATSGKATATDLQAESVDPGAGQDREGAVPPFPATPAGPIG